ncbi:MAG: hypothetical protein J1E61_00825 [Lachnospiraceae bacterium]|nr:hypothetical protein [Lachnospiraceae bacterium]
MSERKHTDYVIERRYLAKISVEEFVRRIVKSHMAGSASEDGRPEECKIREDVLR